MNALVQFLESFPLKQSYQYSQTSVLGYINFNRQKGIFETQGARM